MQTARGGNNAQSVFGIQEIPSDNQIRGMLDPDSHPTLYRWVNLLQGPELGTLKIRVKSGSQWHTYAYRWKIENENNNTLKTKGYHLEHNFGHGKKHLAALLVTMSILAFLFHTVISTFPVGRRSCVS